MPDPFYIGYHDRAPDEVRRVTRAAVAVLAGLVLLSGFLLVNAQEFDDSRFEFGTTSVWEGNYRIHPAPHLALGDGSSILLVGIGKNGARLPAEPGSPVRVPGTLIQRGDSRMLEVLAHQTESLGDAQPIPAPIRAGTERLVGEIVGSKCYLGVMNPGRGAAHRSCARHCILGDVPALLRVDGDASPGTLIVGLESKEMARLAARRVEVQATRYTLPGISWLEVQSAEPLP